MILHGSSIGQELVAALGLEGRSVTRIQFDIQRDEPLTMIVTELVDHTHIEALAKAAKVQDQKCK